MKRLVIEIAGIIFIITLIVAGLTLLNDVSSKPSVVLTNPCDAPCWYGITPGQSDSWAIYTSLNDLKGLKINAVYPEYDRKDKLVSYYWYFERPIKDSGGSVNFINDRVAAINILSVGSLNLKDLFQKLGEPDSYWKAVKYGENREYLDVVLLAPKKGYAAEVVIDVEYGKDQVEISGSTPVFRVTYFAPEAFEALLETKILFGIPVDAKTAVFKPWTGYGVISVDSK